MFNCVCNIYLPLSFNLRTMNVIDITFTTKPHEVMTISQLMNVTGRTRGRISVMVNNEQSLDVCFPFMINKDKRGPMLIVKNQKCKDFINRCMNG